MIHFAGKAVKMLVFFVAAMLLISVYAMAAEVDGASNIAVAAGCTTGSSLRLRKEANTSSEIVSTLNKGYAVAILDNSTPGWYEIAYNGMRGFVSSDYLIVDRDNVFTTYGRVNGEGVNIRSNATTNSEVLAALEKDTIVTINGLKDGWYSVTCKYGTSGYIRSDFLDMTETTNSSSLSNSILGTATKFKGVRYTWGGCSPRGFDCSGFTRYVYGQHGYDLCHSASAQWLNGPGSQIWSIGALTPGDLVFFNDPSRNAGKACSHAGIYVGNGQFIHASSSRGAVVVTDLSNGYYNRYFVGGRHV